MPFYKHELSLPIITIEMLFCYPINIRIFQTLFFKYKIIKKHALLFSSLLLSLYII